MEVTELLLIVKQWVCSPDKQSTELYFTSSNLISPIVKILHLLLSSLIYSSPLEWEPGGAIPPYLIMFSSQGRSLGQ